MLRNRCDMHLRPRRCPRGRRSSRSTANISIGADLLAGGDAERGEVARSFFTGALEEIMLSKVDTSS